MVDIIWPYAAHPELSRSEEYEWNTAINQGPNYEQRIGLRRRPIETVASTFVLHPSELGQARVIADTIYKRGVELLFPHWTNRVFPETEFFGSISIIYGDFRYVTFDPEGQAVVWFSQNEHYVVDILSVHPQQLNIVPRVFADLRGKRAIVMPLIRGRVDGDVRIRQNKSKKHEVLLNVRNRSENQYRYRLNVCIALDGSGSMSGARWNSLLYASGQLLGLLGVLVESTWIDLSIRIVFCRANGLGPDRQHPHVSSPQELFELQKFIKLTGPTTGVFNYPDACNKIVEWFTNTDEGPCTNIGIIMSDADDATDQIMEECEDILEDILDTENPPFRTSDATAVNLYSVGIDANVPTMNRIHRLSNVGPAIRLAGGAQSHFAQVMRDMIFHKDTPLAEFSNMFTYYEGHTVVSRRYVDEAGDEETVTRARTVFVTASGIDWYTDERRINEITRVLKFELMSSAERHAFLIWLHAIKGQRKPFYLPNQNTDLVMVEDQEDLFLMKINRRGLDNPERFMDYTYMIELTKGPPIIAQIVDWLYDEEDEEAWIIEWDTPMPELLRTRDIFGIYMLHMVRFTTDAFEIVHDNLIRSRIGATVTTVPEPLEPLQPQQPDAPH